MKYLSSVDSAIGEILLLNSRVNNQAKAEMNAEN
jgi:hypothetical protein